MVVPEVKEPPLIATFNERSPCPGQHPVCSIKTRDITILKPKLKQL